MKTILVSVFVLLSHLLVAQSYVPVMNFGDLEHRLHMDDEKTWVVNFWATWCAPCVKEMPYFEKIGKDYASQNVQVLLVSLDFVTNLESRVVPFIQNHQIASEVILLDDPRANNWIPKVSEEWSGALPATLIYNKNSRSFYEKTFSFDELEIAVLKALNENSSN